MAYRLFPRFCERRDCLTIPSRLTIRSPIEGYPDVLPDPRTQVLDDVQVPDYLLPWIKLASDFTFRPLG